MISEANENSKAETDQSKQSVPAQVSATTDFATGMIEEPTIPSTQASEALQVECAIRIQRAFRNFTLRKPTFNKLKHLKEIGRAEESALQIYGLNRKLSTQMEVEEAAVQQKINIKMIPVEAMIKIVGFFDQTQFFDFMRVCKHVYKIYRYNQLWNNFFTTFAPSLVEFLVRQNSELEADCINLKSVIWSSIGETARQLADITVQLQAEKDQANVVYKEEKYEAANLLYEKALETAGIFRKPLEATPFYCLKVPAIVEKKVVFLKLIAILNSNLAQSHINLDQHLKAYINCAAAMKHVNMIKQLLDPKVFETDYAEFEAKNKYRFNLSRNKLPFLFRFTRYSPDPVPELKVGSMISASDDMGSGIFENSKIIIYEHDATVV